MRSISLIFSSAASFLRLDCICVEYGVVAGEEKSFNSPNIHHVNELGGRAKSVAEFVEHRFLHYLGSCEGFFQPVMVIVDASPQSSRSVSDILMNMFC